MRKLLIASHGSFASGMKSSLEILLGKAENVTVIDAYLDASRIEDKIEAFLATCSDEDQVFLLSDLFGGSVNQVLCLYLQRPDTYLIAGVNLAIVLELACGQQPLSESEVEEMVEASRQTLRVVKLNSEEPVAADFF
jgi:mannose/fructose-specific phosphotransferase system component IIA